MSMPTAKAHWGRPIWVTEGGAELPVVNIAASTALILGGPGKYSLDRALGIRLPAWLGPLGLVLVILTVLYSSGENQEPQQEDEAREELAGEES
jgi:putative oxidoreductase